jgi:ribosomal protein S1
MKKAIAIIVAVLFVFALTSISLAAEKKAASEKPKVKAVTGEVTAVDTKAGTITVKGKKAEVTVTCDDKTKVKMGKEVKALADVMVGDKVTVKYTEVDGKNVAKSVAIKPAAAAPAEKKAKPAKPAK